jgi:hypothetical protein
MSAEIDVNEPVPKLTAKLRSEIMPSEPFEYTVLEPENKQESNSGLEPAITMIEPVQKRKPERQTASKSKGIRKSLTKSENASISKLHNELQKHSDARKKTDSAILDIKKGTKRLATRTSCNYPRSSKTSNTNE